jgi:hypothetical protein
VLDLFGLNDIAIARDGFSADGMLDRRPDLIVVASRSIKDLDPLFPSEAALTSHPRFSREYRWLRTFDASPHSYHLMPYERAERAPRPAVHAVNSSEGDVLGHERDAEDVEGP